MFLLPENQTIYTVCILGPFTTLRKPMKILLPGRVQEQWPVKAMAIALVGKQKVNTLVQDFWLSVILTDWTVNKVLHLQGNLIEKLYYS